jgi:hypothetical protein
MKIILELEDLQLLPDDVREGLLSYIAQKASPQAVTTTHQFRGPSLYAEVAARDGANCAQCGDDANLEVDFVVPIKLGGETTVGNAQLLCRKHRRLKVDKSEKRDMAIIDAISVEAAVALIEGLSVRSSNLLKAMITLGANSGIKRDNLMDNPDFELKFKDGRSLNGALAGIRKRFRHLFTEGERNSVDLFKYDAYQDTYSLGEGTYLSIKEAFKYFDDQGVYQKNREIKQSSISFYSLGIGTKLENNLEGGDLYGETILILPTAAGPKAPFHEEHFNVDGDWVVHGIEKFESEGDD